MADDLSALVRAFREVTSTSGGDDVDPDVVASRKIELIQAAEDQRAPGVADFFLDVLTDVAEDDLVRTEVIKALRVYEATDNAHARIGEAIAHLARAEPEELVRLHAVAAIERFTDVEAAYATALNLLGSRDEGEAVRSAALSAIEQRGNHPRAVAVFKSLLQDPDFATDARRVLREWHVED
jgi:hypothetical protein